MMYVSKYPRTRFIVFCEDTQVLKWLNQNSAKLFQITDLDSFFSS